MTGIYIIIRKHSTKENTEIRLAEIDQGYSVGVYDLDENQYISNIKIWPNGLRDALKKANRYFSDCVEAADGYGWE